MQLNIIRVDDQITHLALAGSLDLAGLHAVDMKFHSYTAARRKPTLVDLSQVEFVSSLGMGMFISCAQSLARSGVKMVLLSPQPLVEEAMGAVGLGRAISIARSQEEAMGILFPAGEKK
jgi:anti-sigma B factor antagonist